MTTESIPVDTFDPTVIRKFERGTITRLRNAVAREFLPDSRDDPLLPVLRDVFKKSFTPHYSEMLSMLQLSVGETLHEWMEKTFDKLQDSLFTKESRCFLLYDQSEPKKIFGMMTAKMECELDGSLYVAQFCVHPDYKRQGYGGVLLRKLFEFYPSQQKFIGLCRRANKPALQFYLKYGAKYCNDGNIATQWRYPPKLYVGLEFSGDTPSIR